MIDIDIDNLKEQVAEHYGYTLEIPTKWEYFKRARGRTKLFLEAADVLLEFYGDAVAKNQREAAALWIEDKSIMQMPLVTKNDRLALPEK